MATRSERIEAMTKGEILYFDNQYKAERGINPREAEALPMSDFGNSLDRAVSRDIFIEVPGGGGSDYSGSTWTRSNYEYVLDTFKLKNRAGEQVFVRYSGGYGTYGIYANLSAADSEQLEQLAEYIECYELHPVLSDAHLYAVEERQAQEGLDSWALYDFKLELQGKYPALKEIDPATEELGPLWHAMFYEADGYWYNEMGLDMVPCPDPETLVDTLDATRFVEYWALFPSGFEHDFPHSRFNQQQLMLMTWFALPGENELDILLFGRRRK